MKKTNSMALMLKSINQDQRDFTLMDATFIIIDDTVSGNNTHVSRDVLEDAAPTLMDKPIVAKYFPVILGDDDHLGDHEEYVGTDRYGEEILTSDTIPIGHFTTEGYFIEYNGKEVLAADAVLYKEKYPDIIDLLQEWMDKGIQINNSVEYYYNNYEVLDGVVHIKSPLVFSQHAVLNSESRGGYDEVPGAYPDAQLLSMNMIMAWNQSLNNKKGSEGESMSELTKVINELSVGSKVYEINQKLKEVMTVVEWYAMWLSDYNVYEDYFIYEIWNSEDEKYEFFKVSYSVSESDEVTIDYEGKEKIERVVNWEAVSNALEKASELETVQEELNSKNALITERDGKIETLDLSVNKLTEEKEALEQEKNSVTEKLKEAEESMKVLNEALTVYQEKELKEKQENALDSYKGKFISLNALEKFEEEGTQELIKNSVKDEESLKQLNSLIVDLVILKESNEDDKIIPGKPGTKELNNLLPTATVTVADKYGV